MHFFVFFYFGCFSVYLGGTIGSMDGSEGDMIRRIGLARGLLQNLNQVWTSKELSKHTKMRVYEVLILSARCGH